MGKAKKRNFDRCKHLYSMCMKREDAITKVIERLNNNVFDVESKNLITLFGLHPEELSEIILSIVEKIIIEIQNILADTPPELSGDIYTEGIILTGGSANLRGIDKLIENRTNLKVTIPNEPENCVVIGAGIAAKYINKDQHSPETISPLMVEY